MTRKSYLDNIAEKFSILGNKIEMLNANNLNDSSVVSEYFFRDLLNIIYDTNYVNLNDICDNYPGGDLLSLERKTIIQVTSDTSMHKIYDCLRKTANTPYAAFHIKVLYNVNKTPSRRSRDIKIGEIIFNVKGDVIDYKSLIHCIKGLNVEKIKKISDFLNKEIPYERPKNNFESGLVRVIEMLSRGVSLEFKRQSPEKEFEIINKIEFNHLQRTKPLILERCGYSAAIQNVYDMYDAAGRNKSLFIIQEINKAYLLYCADFDGNDLFEKIVEVIREKVEYGANFENVDREEIDFYVDVLIVDTFTRCKIFKRPNAV